MKFLLSVLLVFALSVPAQAANKWSAMIAAEIGMAVLFNPAPGPAPTPAPSGVCANCKGRGKIGDGTVMVTCPVCEGTGKSTTGASLVDLVPDNGGRWTYPGEIKSHLMASHGYTAEQLAGMTGGQLRSLHDASHEGRADLFTSVGGNQQAPVQREAVFKSRGIFKQQPVRSRLPAMRCFGGRCG